MHLRTFGAMSNEVLLHLQAELIVLEDKLRREQAKVQDGNTGIVLGTLDFCRLTVFVVVENQRRLLLDEIKPKIMEYGKCAYSEAQR